MYHSNLFPQTCFLILSGAPAFNLPTLTEPRHVHLEGDLAAQAHGVDQAGQLEVCWASPHLVQYSAQLIMII